MVTTATILLLFNSGNKLEGIQDNALQQYRRLPSLILEQPRVYSWLPEDLLHLYKVQ
jgi:hypothetical protein